VAFPVDELLLKTFCSFNNMLLVVMYWFNQIYITFSTTFEKDDSNDIRL
jgi:hypothetical protein